MPATASIFYPFFDNPIGEKISSFSRLKAGWHYGEGVAFTEAQIQEALRIAYAGLESNNLADIDAFPGFSGEIRVCFYTQYDYLEFTLEPDFTVVARVEYADALTHNQILADVDEAIEFLQSYTSPTWSSSGFYLLSTMTENDDDFKVLLFDQRQVTPTSLSSARNAQTTNTPFADTSRFTIKTSLNRLLFSGVSSNQIFPACPA